MGAIAGNKSKLKKSFTADGYQLKRLKFKGDIYLYERIALREEWMEADYKLTPHYEVVKPVKYSSLLPNGKKRDGYSYPASSWWGKKGWTFTDKNKAENKFNELLNN